MATSNKNIETKKGNSNTPYLYSGKKYAVITGNCRIAPPIMKHLKELGTWPYNFRMFIKTLSEDMFVYGYRANTSGRNWTASGKRKAIRLMQAVSQLHDFVTGFEWKKGNPAMTSQEVWHFYNLMKNYFDGGDSEYIELLKEITTISTHYKYIADKEDPTDDIFEINGLLNTLSKIDDLFYEVREAIEKEGELNTVEPADAEVKHLPAPNRFNELQPGHYTVITTDLDNEGNNIQYWISLIRYDKKAGTLIGAALDTEDYLHLDISKIKEVYTYTPQTNKAPAIQ